MSRTESPLRTSSASSAGTAVSATSSPLPEKRSSSMQLDDTRAARASKSREHVHSVTHANSTGNISDGNASDSGERSRSSATRKSSSSSRRTSRSSQRDAVRSPSGNILSHKNSTDSLPSSDDTAATAPPGAAAISSSKIVFSDDDPPEIQSASLEGLNEYMRQQMSTAEQSAECAFCFPSCGHCAPFSSFRRPVYFFSGFLCSKDRHAYLAKQFIEQLIVTHRYFTTTPAMLDMIVKTYVSPFPPYVYTFLY